MQEWKCELCGTNSDTLYDCWFRVRCPLTNENRINQRYCVCECCSKQSIAYEKIAGSSNSKIGGSEPLDGGSITLTLP